MNPKKGRLNHGRTLRYAPSGGRPDIMEFTGQLTLGNTLKGAEYGIDDEL